MTEADIDFDTGRLNDVSAARHGTARREYFLLGVVLAASAVPYAAFFYFQPLAAIWLMCVLAFLQVMVTFATSVQTTGTSHHMRFILAGRNPVAMTGGASLLLGGVDSIIDWREDQATRRRHPLWFGLQTFFKLMATPLGLIVILGEAFWDLALLSRGPRLLACKRLEFFSLAKFHDMVCPEKSNDIFYADLAFARYLDDRHLYQWNRLRALVFELQHYFIDVSESIGVPETNLLLQDDVTAYQTLKRLECERLEQFVAAHYKMFPDRFLLPPRLTSILVRNARPIEHYLRFRKRVLTETTYVGEQAWELELQELVGTLESRPLILPWHILRVLEEPEAVVSIATSNYLGEITIEAMIDRGFLQPLPGEQDRFQITPEFRAAVKAWIERYFRLASAEEIESVQLQRLPTLLHAWGCDYVPRGHTLESSVPRQHV